MTTNVQQIIPEAQSLATLVTVTECQTIQDALSLMIEHDFSQLPVIDTTGKLQGLISSDSILKAISYFKVQLDRIYVSNAMLDPSICRADDDIAELLSLLKENDAVLVVGKGHKLIGILTSYDTTEYYLRQAENFMLVKEIESLVCEYIQYVYEDDISLSAAVSSILSPGISNDDAKKFLNKYLKDKGINVGFDKSIYDKVYQECFVAPVKHFSDLTLQQYIQLLSKIWGSHQQTFHNLEWSAIRNLLEDVRKIRNSIAHFREVTPLEQKKLYFGAQLLNR